MKKILCAALGALLCLLFVPAAAAQTPPPAIPQTAVELRGAAAAILMEKETGAVLYEYNAHQALPPASVTKVMTLLLVMDAVDSGALNRDTLLTVSPTAAAMGGSQVYLASGEQICVDDLLKAVCLASGNDAAVALAEAVAGSESAFVAQMNETAAQLGMDDTHFLNCTGLPADGHETSAADIALMSRELILKHPSVRRYTTLWMDSLRGGAFSLANTNRLIHSYPGATGLKTGSTDAARYCLSATAERDGMELIAVVLAAPTSADRFATAAALLDQGFAGYTLFPVAPKQVVAAVPVRLGVQDSVQPVLEKTALLLTRAQAAAAESTLSLSPMVDAPVAQGQVLGQLCVRAGDDVLAQFPLTAAQGVARMAPPQILRALILAGFGR